MPIESFGRSVSKTRKDRNITRGVVNDGRLLTPVIYARRGWSSVEVFLMDPKPYLHNVRRKLPKTIGRLIEKAIGIEPSISRLPAEPPGH